MEASQTENGQIPLILIHGAWLSARNWENYTGCAAAAYERHAVPETGQILYEGGFANFELHPPTEVDFKSEVDSWLDSVLDAPEPATRQA